MREARELRVTHSSDSGLGSGYVALYVVGADGQWGLALDGTYGNRAEQEQVLSDVMAIACNYVGSPALSL